MDEGVRQMNYIFSLLLVMDAVIAGYWSVVILFHHGQSRQIFFQIPREEWMEEGGRLRDLMIT